MQLRVGTTNAHKLRELEEMLAPLGFVVRGVEGLRFEVEEDADTIAGNALKKARALLALTGEPALADDSGLEVDALSGAPGVHSARYAGVTGPDQDAANRKKLILALANVAPERRGARFRCALAYVTANSEHVFEGTLEGRIGSSERGEHGFGYDALFELPSQGGRTLAELSSAEKHAVSHRGAALEKLVAHLRTRG